MNFPQLLGGRITERNYPGRGCLDSGWFGRSNREEYNRTLGTSRPSRVENEDDKSTEDLRNLATLRATPAVIRHHVLYRSRGAVKLSQKAP